MLEEKIIQNHSIISYFIKLLRQLYIPSIVTQLKKDEFIPQAQRSPFLHSSNENANFKMTIKDTKIDKDNVNHDTPSAPRQSMLARKKLLSKSLTRKSLLPITTPINRIKSASTLPNPEIFTFSQDGGSSTMLNSTTDSLNNNSFYSTTLLDTWNMSRSIRPHSSTEYKYDTAYFVPVTYECPRVRNNPGLVKMSQTAKFEKEYRLNSYSKPFDTSYKSYKYLSDQAIHKIHYDKSKKLSQSMPNLRSNNYYENDESQLPTSPVHVPENPRTSISHTVPRIMKNNVKHENKNGTVIGEWPIQQIAQTDLVVFFKFYIFIV